MHILSVDGSFITKLCDGILWLDSFPGYDICHIYVVLPEGSNYWMLDVCTLLFQLLCLQYFNQILTAVLEVLDDSDSSTRELALSLIAEILKNQVLNT